MTYNNWVETQEGYAYLTIWNSMPMWTG